MGASVRVSVRVRGRIRVRGYGLGLGLGSGGGISYFVGPVFRDVLLYHVFKSLAIGDSGEIGVVGNAFIAIAKHHTGGIAPIHRSMGVAVVTNRCIQISLVVLFVALVVVVVVVLVLVLVLVLFFVLVVVVVAVAVVVLVVVVVLVLFRHCNQRDAIELAKFEVIK